MKERSGHRGSRDEFEALRREQRQAYIRRWRMKAEEVRIIAEAMTDAGGRRLMLNAAANYERLAEAAEEHDAPAPSRSNSALTAAG